MRRIGISYSIPRMEFVSQQHDLTNLVVRVSVCRLVFSLAIEAYTPPGILPNCKARKSRFSYRLRSTRYNYRLRTDSAAEYAEQEIFSEGTQEAVESFLVAGSCKETADTV